MPSLRLPVSVADDGFLTQQEISMSNLYNDLLLERLFEEALDLGMSDDEAEDYARSRIDEVCFTHIEPDE